MASLGTTRALLLAQRVIRPVPKVCGRSLRFRLPAGARARGRTALEEALRLAVRGEQRLDLPAHRRVAAAALVEEGVEVLRRAEQRLAEEGLDAREPVLVHSRSEDRPPRRKG